LGKFRIDGITSVIFDLDSTLTNTHRYPIRAAQWLLSNLPDITPELEEKYVRHLIGHYFQKIREIADGAPYIPAYNIVREAMSVSLTDIDRKLDEEVVDEATGIFRNLHVELSTLYPGIKELLEELSAKNYKLALITNSFEGNAEIITKKLGIYSYFTAILDGAQYHGYKPMPEVFNYALSRLEELAENTLFVGDEYYADISGAAQVGMKTVWVDVRGQSLEYAMEHYGKSVTPDLIISKISELLDHL
jgi:2-haloalkanoic acid dehalogenase type II